MSKTRRRRKKRAGKKQNKDEIRRETDSHTYLDSNMLSGTNVRCAMSALSSTFIVSIQWLHLNSFSFFVYRNDRYTHAHRFQSTLLSSSCANFSTNRNFSCYNVLISVWVLLYVFLFVVISNFQQGQRQTDRKETKKKESKSRLWREAEEI